MIASYIYIYIYTWDYVIIFLSQTKIIVSYEFPFSVFTCDSVSVGVIT